MRHRGVSTPPFGTPAEVTIPTAVVATAGTASSPPAELKLVRSLHGAHAHSVEGDHFAFSRYDVFAPLLLEACQTVVPGRVHDGSDRRSPRLRPRRRSKRSGSRAGLPVPRCRSGASVPSLAVSFGRCVRYVGRHVN